MIRPRSGIRARRALFLLLVVVLAVGLARIAGCRFEPPRPLAVVILDKTVPDASYREHRALWNVLDEGYVNAATGERFSIADDYYGFVPVGEDSWTIRPLPARFEQLDLFYLADAYGVYARDFFGSNPEGEHSARLYGGLTLADVAAAERARDAGALVVAEFNTFASPTPSGAAEAMSGLLGVRWTGWIGRHFTNLVAGGEVPAWAVRNYEAREGRRWAWSGPGYLFVQGDRVVVLEEGEDEEAAIRPDGCRFTPSETGASLFPDVRPAAYRYWFDVLEPLPGTSVLAEFSLDVTVTGAGLLQGSGIPTRFPAVTLRASRTGNVLYFSGDFADRDDRFSLLRGDREATFHRRVYTPLMRMLLDHAAMARDGGRPVRFPGIPVTEGGTAITAPEPDLRPER